MVPDQLEDFTDKKLYLHATEKLCHSHELLCTDLKDVHALKDIAYSLNNWKEVSLAKKWILFEIYYQCSFLHYNNVVPIVKCKSM